MANYFDQFDAPSQENFFDQFDKSAKKDPGFLSNVGNLLVEGGEQAIAAAKVAPSVVTGQGVEGQAGLIAERLAKPQTGQPKELQEVKGAFKDEGEAWEKSEGFLQGASAIGQMLFEVGRQAVTNPKGLAYMTAEQAANMAPAIVGMIAGGKVGGVVGTAALPGPGTAIGTVTGAVGGAFAGQAPLEVGSEFISLVGKELSARNLPATEANVAALLSDREFTERAIGDARVKGATTAGIDAALTVASGGVATGPRRIALKAATEELGAGADAAQIAKRATEILDQRTIGQKVQTGAAAVGVDVAGGGLSEAGGQLAAYGQVDLADVGLEMLGELGGAGIEVPAAAYTMSRDEMSRRRQAVAQQNLNAATDASSAAAAANDLAGSVDELTAALDDYLGKQAAVTQQTQIGIDQAQNQVSPLVAQQRLIDREAALLGQADQAGVDFERRMAMDHIAALRDEPKQGAAEGFVDLTPMNEMQARQRLTVLRDQTAQAGGNALGLTIVPHPQQQGRFAIAEQQLPSLDLPSNQPTIPTAAAQMRIESAALAGSEQQRRAEDSPRQQMISRAMANIEARGGVASPMEAEILRQANMGQPFDRIDTNLAPALTPDDQLTQATGISLERAPRESQRLAADMQATAEVQAEQAARVRADRTQAERQTLQDIERTSQPAALPAASEVIGALAVPGAQRTAEQVSLIRQAESRFDPVDFSIMQRAASAPFNLSADERVRLRELRSPTVSPSVTAETETVTNETGLLGSRVAERLGQPSTGRIITSNAKLSTTRNVAPGATVTIADGGTNHTVNVVDTSRLGVQGRLLAQIARIFGKRLVVFDSETLQADGFVLNDDNRSVFINAKSQINPLAVFGHELTHLLKRDNPEAYAALQAVVEREMGEGAMDRFTQEYGDGANIEELTSDLVGNRFQEPDFWQSVFDEIAAQNPEGARGIIIRTAAAITKAINAFMRLVRQPGFQADAYIKDANEIKKAVRTALATYAQSQRATAMQMEGGIAQAESQVDLTAGSRDEPPAQATFDERRREGARAARTQMGETVTASRVRPNEFKATAEDKAMAETYEERTGLDPYLSEGQIDLPLEGSGAKFSVKRPYGDKEFAKGRANDPITGLPLNKNGTVTLYYPTNNDGARELARTKKLKPSSPTANRIYLTNESSGPKVMNDRGNIDQEVDGANVLIQVDPSLLHLDREYEDGRKDFFIPIAEGKAFQSKMTRLFTLDAPRTRALSKDTKLTDLERRIGDSINEYLQMDGAARRARLKQAKDVLKEQHNVGTLLGVNGKLEKTNTGGYGLNNYNGKDVMSMGLGLASAQKINEKNLSTCPNSAICEGLCLGETSGQNLLYGGEGQFKSGPRLAQYLKTEAMVQHPEDFAIVLHAEIEKFQRVATKEDYQPTVRLNVTSDFRPQTFEAIISAFPGVMFYDYTKLPTNSIAPNHHLTYSSTGASQVVNGKTIVNKESNWDKMVEDRLNKGMNVAMAFTSRTDMPDFVMDERTGRRFQVWNGDNYDARFLDPKPGQEGNLLDRGMIIGLTNKDKTTKPEEAAEVHNGFFLDYDRERDGDTLIIRDQKALASGGRRTIPIAAARSEVVSTDASAADEVLSFSRRRKPAPKETVTAYKLFRVDARKPGQLFPLFVNANDPVEIGVWLDAEEGPAAAGGKVKSKLGPLAYRPGWHAGDVPIATHIGSKSDPALTKPDTRPENHVWAEVELAADRDWQAEANKRGTNAQGKLIAGRAHITDQIPVDGYYRYKTNPNMTGTWLIGGSMKVNRILSDTEVEQINEEAGVADLPREAPFDAAKYGFDAKLSRRRPQVDTPEFKRWFGDSKIVDENGDPLVVYHGTKDSLSRFDLDHPNRKDTGWLGTGVYVTDSTDLSTLYSYVKRGKDGAQVLPLYARVENPYYSTPEEKMELAGMTREESDQFTEQLKEQGYDGVIVELEEGVREIVVFDPAGVKSATGNQGTFDPNNADITMSRRRQIDTPEFKRWFGDSKVVDENGDPLVVYRGEHGADDGGMNFQSRRASLSFGSQEVANVYAQEPNDSDDRAEAPRVFPVYIRIKNPLINTPGDPFIELNEVADKLGFDVAEEAARKFAAEIEETGNWQENFASEYDSVDQLLDENPDAVRKLYTLAWRFFDSPEFVAAAKRKGYDGAIHAEYGIHSQNQEGAEYKVFDQSQVKSAIGNQGTFDPNNEDITQSRRRNIMGQPMPLARWTAPTETKLDDAIYYMQDKMVDTKRVAEAVKAAVGNIDDRWNPYLQEELFHGRTAKSTKDFLNDELRPLLQEMQMRKVDLAELETYLHNRHAEERNIQIAKVNPNMPDGGSGIDTQDARNYLAGLDPTKRRQLEALAKRVDAITANTRQLLVASGLETADTIAAWEGAYKNYVPLQREDLDFSSQFSGLGTGQGYQVKGPSSKRATGSKRDVVDILANIAMQRERAIVRSEKMRVAQAVYGMAVQNPNTDFWLAIDPAGQKDPAKAIQDLISMGIDPADARNIVEEPKQTFIDPRTGLVTQRVNPLLRNSPNVMAVRINGEEKYVFFNANDERSQRMVTALKNLDADQLGRVLSYAGLVTRYFAAVNTQYNPIFGAINLMRDVQGATLQLSTTPIADRKKEVLGNVIPALRGIYADVRATRKGKPSPTGTWATLWEEFQREGGQTGFRDQFSKSAERAEALERELKRISEGKVKQAGRVVFDWLSDYNETMENAVRLSAYKAAKDKGLSNQQAASIAKNLTVNFNRKGQVATQVGALYAFFNAAMQGSTRLVQTLQGPAGKKIVAGGLLLGAVQAMALAAAGFDEDEPPEFVKERNLIIPLPDGKYLTVPMPLGYNVIPNTSRVLTEFVMSGFRDPAKRVGQITGAFLEMFNPIGNAGWSVQTIAPTIADPLVALKENRDWTGKPIAKEDMSSLDPTPGYTRAKETASWFAKELAYYLNLASGGTKYKPGIISWTPDQIDYLIGQATGGVGRELLKVEQTATSSVTGEELPPYKIPVVGRFYGDAKSASAESNRFYENLTRINEHENEIKGRRKNREPVGEYLRDNPEARLVNLANKVEREVSELRRRRRELVERDASKESVQIIEKRIAARMKQFNDRVRALREKQTADGADD